MNRYFIQKKNWVFIGLICLGIIITCLSFKSSKQTTDKTNWQTIAKRNLVIELIESGEIEATQTVEIKAPQIGHEELQIIRLIPEGTIVNEGDFIVQFDAANFFKELEKLENEYTASVAELKELESSQEIRLAELRATLTGITLSMENTKLQQQLLKFQAAAKRQEAELEHKKELLQLREAETAISSQKIIDKAERNKLIVKMNNAMENLNRMKEKIKQLELRSPQSGMIVYCETGQNDSKHKIDTGDKIKPGRAVLNIPDMDSMQVKLSVNEIDALKIRPGLGAAIQLEAYPEKHYQGTTKQVSLIALNEGYDSQIKNFNITIAISQPDTLVKPGMTASVRIALDTLNNVLSIPVGTVYEKQGEPVIFPETIYPEPLKIKLQKRTDIFTAIESDILKAGDRIASHAPNMSDNKRLGYFAYYTKYYAENAHLPDSIPEMRNLKRRIGNGRTKNKPSEFFKPREGFPIDFFK